MSSIDSTEIQKMNAINNNQTASVDHLLSLIQAGISWMLVLFGSKVLLACIWMCFYFREVRLQNSQLHGREERQDEISLLKSNTELAICLIPTGHWVWMVLFRQRKTQFSFLCSGQEQYLVFGPLPRADWQWIYGTLLVMLVHWSKTGHLCTSEIM